MRKKRREFDIFSLSFLDIISCGFGAVVLLVLISKTSESPVKTIEQDAMTMLAQVLNAEDVVTSLNDQLVALHASIESQRILRDRLRGMANQTATAESVSTDQAETLAKDIAGLKTVQSALERLKSTKLSRKTTQIRDDDVGGIPVDSDYVIFIVDTSGSMQEIWPRVTREIENIINIHPKVKGFQILNDNGTHILNGYQGKWIPDTPGRRKSVIKLFKNWNSASNSSPVEGLEVALKRYVNPNIKVSIYIFGDDYTGSSFDPVINSLVRMNTNRVTGARLARVHGVGFMSQYTTNRFATLMREVARRNDGTFIALPR